jgi:glucose-6-phosphate-specific signal transduction histidine kinase
MSRREQYDPKMPVCNNQADFNMAVEKAIDYNNDKSKHKKWYTLYLVIWIVFFVWGIMLAVKVSPGHERIEHLVLAMVFSPLYVLAYYMGAFGHHSDVPSGIMGAPMGFRGW